MGFDTLAAAIQSVNAAIETIRAISSANGAIERAELKFKVADMMEALAEAKLALAAGIEERQSLQQQISQLESVVKSKAKLRRVGDAYYELSEDGEPHGDPYCSLCWERNHSLIHLISPKPTELHSSCGACGTKYPRQRTEFGIGKTG